MTVEFVEIPEAVFVGMTLRTREGYLFLVADTETAFRLQALRDEEHEMRKPKGKGGKKC